jgi:hypothetical protein
VHQETFSYQERKKERKKKGNSKPEYITIA